MAINESLKTSKRYQEGDLLDTEEAAAYLHVHPSSFDRHIKRGLRVYKVAQGNLFFYEDLVDYVKKHETTRKTDDDIEREATEYCNKKKISNVIRGKARV